MDISRRAFYNSLRQSWVKEPRADIEAWQVEDYRSMPLDQLFERLEDLGIFLNKASFVADADSTDSPEDLADTLAVSLGAEETLCDQVYLVVFELWRRFLPEKPTLSLLCDELDHQIQLYDRGESESTDGMQDVLANLQVILDENVDAGTDPIEAFIYIKEGCANDLEAFLYDYIAEQIDSGNELYAEELLDGFKNYIEDEKWFAFLRARLLASVDPEDGAAIIKKLFSNKKNLSDLKFNLEVLSFLVTYGDRDTFESLVKKTAEMLETEEDFQFLVAICADFYHRIDRDQIEKALQGILDKRTHADPDRPFDRSDVHFSELLKILSKA